MKKRIVYFGYLAKGFLPFLIQLKKELENNDCEFLLFFTAINANDLNNNELDNLEYINFNHFHFYPYEDFFNSIKADFYILWGGYDGVLAHYRNYLLQENIPHLLCEYTGIKNLFHFDTALNGESSFVTAKSLPKTKIDFSTNYDDILDKYIPITNTVSDKLMFLVEKYKNIISYFGMWDWAAGLNNTNSMDIQSKISENYSSSYDAMIDVYNNLPVNSLLIIKPHPHDSYENKKLYEQFCENHNNVIYIDSNFSAQDIIAVSDVICTIASTINLIAMYQKKPLVILGKTYISTSKYPFQVNNHTHLSECLRSALRQEDWELKLNERSIFISNFLSNAEMFSADEKLIKIGVKGVEQLSKNIIEQVKNNRIISSHSPFYALTEALLNEIRKSQRELIDRTQTLEIAERELIDRTQRLEVSEKELIDRTKRLEVSEHELINCTIKLEAVEKELIDRTQRLEVAKINLDKYQKSSFVFRGKIIF